MWKIDAVITPNSVTGRYFIVGVFAWLFVLQLRLNQIFSNQRIHKIFLSNTGYRRDLKLTGSSSVTSLVFVSSLMTFAEQNVVAKYKYITVIIGGRKFFVSPYEWISDDSTL